MRRTFNVGYKHSRGVSETQVDIEDAPVDEMMNEMLSLVYQITDESKERNVRIIDIYEVPYDGEEK